MTTGDVGEWLMRGQAAATILFNDPLWAAQTCEMDPGEPELDAYDPPLPGELVDGLRDRQRRLNALEALMLAEGRADDPPPQDRNVWTRPHESLLLAGRSLDRRGICWVPSYLLNEFQTLYTTPLPHSAELIGKQP